MVFNYLSGGIFFPHHSVKIDLTVFSNDILLGKRYGEYLFLIISYSYELDIDTLLCFLRMVLNHVHFILKHYSIICVFFFLCFSFSTCCLNDNVAFQFFSKLSTLFLSILHPLSNSKPVNKKKFQENRKPHTQNSQNLNVWWWNFQQLFLLVWFIAFEGNDFSI